MVAFGGTASAMFLAGCASGSKGPFFRSSGRTNGPMISRQTPGRDPFLDVEHLVERSDGPRRQGRNAEQTPRGTIARTSLSQRFNRNRVASTGDAVPRPPAGAEPPRFPNAGSVSRIDRPFPEANSTSQPVASRGAGGDPFLGLERKPVTVRIIPRNPSPETQSPDDAPPASDPVEQNSESREEPRWRAIAPNAGEPLPAPPEKPLAATVQPVSASAPAPFPSERTQATPTAPLPFPREQAERSRAVHSATQAIVAGDVEAVEPAAADARPVAARPWVWIGLGLLATIFVVFRRRRRTAVAA
jgi:hypothetical protein